MEILRLVSAGDDFFLMVESEPDIWYSLDGQECFTPIEKGILVWYVIPNIIEYFYKDESESFQRASLSVQKQAYLNKIIKTRPRTKRVW